MSKKETLTLGDLATRPYVRLGETARFEMQVSKPGVTAALHFGPSIRNLPREDGYILGEKDAVIGISVKAGRNVLAEFEVKWDNDLAKMNGVTVRRLRQMAIQAVLTEKNSSIRPPCDSPSLH